MKRYLLGVDIGGTKCAVNYGYEEDDNLYIVDKIRFETTTVDRTLEDILKTIELLIEKHQLTAKDICAIGISSGGPLDSTTGVIMSPPNLIGWDNIPIVNIIEDKFGIKAFLQNDANACALAEWKFGSGKGTRNMVFMTFGTGLGAGLVIDGKLYTGTNDNAGELGHIRLAHYGPVGYGKSGSFEGFCSGGGIAQIAKILVLEKLQMGEEVSWCTREQLESITAQKIAEEANRGDELASEIFRISGEKLGEGLSILIDILNPEVIVIGSIFTRCSELLRPHMQSVIDREALPLASRACRVEVSKLGENIGDYAALSVAANSL
ncbi:ROK family protein [Dysgonomonas sp. Marseille-P4361]|uniref:ROK family protein n=1 Tax=Dysgonomonas sp. Marseille-P4361 TaxID=2161820 RepID=UPI000D5558A5|nr:ROK family protein [Dysgonomonas sp. Marseille-P4361]